MPITRWHIVGVLMAVVLMFAVRGRDLSTFQFGLAVAGSMTALALLPFAVRRLFEAASPAKKTDFVGYAFIVLATTVIFWSIKSTL